MGHWMTLSGELMMTLLVLGAIVFFATDRSGSGVASRSRIPGGGGSGADLDA